VLKSKEKTKMRKKMLKISSGLALVCICLLGSGCSNSSRDLAKVLADIGTNTNGKVTIKMEVGPWGNKGTFIFEDVDVEKLNKPSAVGGLIDE
jgi:hypothetical protein